MNQETFDKLQKFHALKIDKITDKVDSAIIDAIGNLENLGFTLTDSVEMIRDFLKENY